MARDGAQGLTLVRPVIALLTDFGTEDPFVGIMKSVVLGRCPDATFIDLTHAVPPQAIAEGAFLLERCVDFLPRGTVVIAVVDPGVGTERRPIVLRALDRVFVGPDNGLFSAIADRDPAFEANSIDTQRLGLTVPSRTFHGRDVFAPVAAELSAGRLLASSVGPRVERLVSAVIPRAAAAGSMVKGTVVTIDRFGNLITNIERTLVAPAVVAEIGPARAVLRATYGEALPGELLALINSFDVLEVAVREGSAARVLGAARGAEVVLRPASSSRA